MEAIFHPSILFGLLIGAISCYLIFKNKLKEKPDNKEQERAWELEHLGMQKELEHLNSRIENSILEFDKQKKREIELQEKIVDLSKDFTRVQTEKVNLEEQLENQKEELVQVQEKLNKEFQLIANSILKQNANDLSKSHQKELNQVLNPLQEKLKSFEEKIEKNYKNQSDERLVLKEELKRLMDLNQNLNEQAQNLTTALKGENKTQGNWGELILERVLERSGLIKGDEYETQFSDTNRDEKRIQPDVIIHLPDEKHIIVDAKVSLVAYERYVNAEEDAIKDLALKQHIASIKDHIKNLSEKNYQTAKTLNSPDFVLLFIPIESSFSLAVQADYSLFNYAWDRKIVVVSPTTLLATLRTVSSLWKHERQTKNAIEIADKAGDLYDKFIGFIEDLKRIDHSLSMGRKAYDDAFNKLSSGRGNLVKRADDLKKMGAKANKTIPAEFLKESEHEDL